MYISSVTSYMSALKYYIYKSNLSPSLRERGQG